MAANSPAPTTTSRRTVKCEFCSRTLLSTAGLYSHLRSFHYFALKDKEEKEKKSAKRKKKEVKEVPKNTNEATEKLKLPDDRKVEYKCPICETIFPVFVSAQLHIQKYHCVNKAGRRVKPTSPNIIQPVLTEICGRCNLQFTDTHNCGFHWVLKIGCSYQCIGCQQRFPNMRHFHFHVASLHSEGLENMFFPTKEEFNKWLIQMESQTHTKYVVMAQYMAKHIYCCSFAHDYNAEDTFQLCPSIITYQELPKGKQVHYYSNHLGHDVKRYILPVDYKPYSMSHSTMFWVTSPVGLRKNKRKRKRQKKKTPELPPASLITSEG